MKREITGVLKKPMDRQTLQEWKADKYLWMSLGFALLYIFIAQHRGLSLVPAWALWLLFGIGVANGALRTYLRFNAPGQTQQSPVAKLWTALDVLLIALAVCFSSGLKSDIWLLYFITMVSQCLSASPAQIVAAYSAIAASYIVAALIPQVYFHNMGWSEFTSTLTLRLFFIIVVGTYTRRISLNAEERNHELSILHEQMATGEERARIAREVHDGLGHALVSIILRLELAARLLRPAPDEAEAILKDEIPALRAAWNEGRDMAFHLHPWEADTANNEELSIMLRRHVARFAERTGLTITLDADSCTPTLRPAVAFGLTRIVQEALTNAARHSHATRIDVTLRCPQSNNLTCTITDNGKGFAPDSTQAGFGLTAMRQRAESLHGACTVESSIDQGTCVTVTLPV